MWQGLAGERMLRGKSGVPERKVPIPGAFRSMVQFFFLFTDH